MIVFDQDRDIKLVVEADADEAILSAVYDLRRNLRQLSGKTDGFEVTTQNDGCGIVVKTEASDEIEA